MTSPSVNPGTRRASAFAVGSLVLLAGALGAQPTNNPVTAAFTGEYAWTDALKWGTVTTTAANGADTNDDLDVVAAEIAALAESGGGVLYFPAGDYYFRDHLVLKAGVIIRGATPAVADAREENYDPPTNFWFPKFEWGGFGANYSDKATKLNLIKKIEVDNPQHASRYGIVNVDVQRALIDFVARFNETGDEAAPVRDPYEDFAQYFGTGIKNRLTGGEVVVFGNRVNNATALDPRVPNTAQTATGPSHRVGLPRQNAWQIWFNRGHAKIDVQVTDYVIIANNRINDIPWQFYVNSPGSLAFGPIDDFNLPFQSPLTDALQASNQSYLRNNATSQMPREMTGGATAPEFERFQFSDGYGILANRSSRVGFGRMNTPVNEPMIYRKGVTVRRNWVYSTQRVGIQAGGDGLEVIDNVKRDRPGKRVWMAADGSAMNTNNSATYENRSLDVTGTNIVVRGNNLYTERHGLRDSVYGSIDGEGILVQDNNAGWITGWRIEDNVTNTYIGIYKVWFIRDMVIRNNTITAGNILIDADDNGSPSGIYDLEVSGNSASNGIVITGGIVGRNIKVLNNTSAGGTIRATNYGTFNEFVYTASGNSPEFTTFDGSVSGTPIPVPANNAIDAPPQVEILVPARGQTLTPGETMTVQVKVTLDPDGAGIPVQEVRFYDGSGLTRDYKQDFVNWYTGANAIPATGYLILADGDADGIYTGQWTVPTTIPLKQVFPAVEARLAPVTVKNTKAAGAPDLSYSLRSYAFLDVGSPNKAPTVPPGFASWRTEFSLPAGKDGLLDDADGDGVPNLLEYAFGMNPNEAANGGNGPQVGREVVGTTPYVTYSFNKLAGAEVQYVTQFASSLAGPWNAIGLIDGVIVEESASAVTVKVPEASAGAFLRVNVSVAP